MGEQSNKVKELLNKKFGKQIIQIASEMKGLEVERISTGSIAVDIETGGGLPKGRLVEIYGRESSGKTYISLKTVANGQKEKKCLWIDAEGVFDVAWAKLVGVDLSKLDIAKTETAEQAGTILDAATRSNEYAIIVLDSVAALLPNEDLDKALDESERIGNRAMVTNRITRKLQSGLNAKEDGELPNQTLVIFINQIREKIGVVYGDPTDTPGGLGIRFMASIRLEMRRSDLIKETPKKGDTGISPDGKSIVGVTIKFKTVKNKTACPLKTGQFILYTEDERKGQIDKTDEIIRYALVSGVIQHSGPSYSYKNHKFLGKEAVIEYLKEHPENIEELYTEIKKVY